MADALGRAERVRNRVREAWAFRGRLRRLERLPFEEPRREVPRADVIVSITSHRPRLASLGIALRSLLDQSRPPERVVLWVPADDGAHLPGDVLELAGFRLEIRTMLRDLGSAGKLLPTLLAYPGRNVVTADDDVIYARHWLRDLLKTHECWPRAIVCARAHYLEFDPIGNLLPYLDWQWDTNRTGPDSRLFFTGHGGVLYPAGSLPETVHDDITRRSLCPDADDVWFNWMARLAGTPIVRTPGAAPRHNHVPLSQGTTLMTRNVAGGGNDAQIRSLVARYGALDRDTGALRPDGAE